jgi:putative inorganic carbon (HCO3(-)) transporter
MNQISITAHKPHNIVFYLYILWAIVIPWFFAPMQIVLGLIIFTTILDSIIKKRRLILFHPFYYFIAAYLIVRLVAALLSPQPLRSVSNVIDTEWVLISVPILASTLIDMKNRRLIINVLIGSAAVAGIYAIFQFITGIDIFRNRMIDDLLGQFYRASGGYNFYLSFAGNQLMILYSALFLFIMYERWQIKKISYFVAVILIVASIIATFARSTWVAFMLVFWIGTILFNRKLFWTIALPVSILGAIFILSVPDLQDRIMSIFSLAQNEGRLNLWKSSMLMIKDHPWFGIGAGLFGETVKIYKVPGYYDSFAHAHNDHLHSLVTNGIFGFIAWITMWSAWFYYLYKSIHNSLFSKVDQSLLTGIFMSIASILVAAFFQCYYLDLENNILWCFFLIFGLQIMQFPESVSNKEVMTKED